VKFIYLHKVIVIVLTVPRLPRLVQSKSKSLCPHPMRKPPLRQASKTILSVEAVDKYFTTELRSTVVWVASAAYLIQNPLRRLRLYT
jgi:hypothetical protein